MLDIKKGKLFLNNSLKCIYNIKKTINVKYLCTQIVFMKRNTSKPSLNKGKLSNISNFEY